MTELPPPNPDAPPSPTYTTPPGAYAFPPVAVPPLPAPPPTPWGPWATVGFVAASMAIAVVMSTVVAVLWFVGELLVRGEMMSDDLVTTSMLAMAMTVVAVSQVVALGAVIFFAWLRKPITLRDYFALRPASLKVLGLAALAMVGFVVFESTLNWLLVQDVPESMTELMASVAVLPLVWVVVVIVAPVCEEVVFRGFMWKGLIKSRLGLHGTNLITCLPWTLLHLGQYGWLNMVLIFLAGLLFGYARHLSKSLWVPMFMHFAMNFFAMSVMTYYWATGQL